MQQKTDTDNNDSTKIPSIKKNKITTQSSINKSLTNQNERQNLTEQSNEKNNANENKLTISITGMLQVFTMDDGQ
jgi:hypothetical protein